jgi:hypothetical protein
VLLTVVKVLLASCVAASIDRRYAGWDVAGSGSFWLEETAVFDSGVLVAAMKVRRQLIRHNAVQ